MSDFLKFLSFMYCISYNEMFFHHGNYLNSWMSPELDKGEQPLDRGVNMNLSLSAGIIP